MAVEVLTRERSNFSQRNLRPFSAKSPYIVRFNVINLMDVKNSTVKIAILSAYSCHIFI
jgi:hypothetical protein